MSDTYRQPPMNISEFVTKRNQEIALFTPGPASLTSANILGLRSAFGRGDNHYLHTESKVSTQIRKMSGQSHIVALQGSATLALEIACRNFLFGRVLVVSSGYYSSRLLSLVHLARAADPSEIREVHSVSWTDISDFSGNFDWVLACTTETSLGLHVSPRHLAVLAKHTQAKLLLDATASMGLEDGHSEGEVVCFSSCKGLFGLSGASFISYNSMPEREVSSYYLSMRTHVERGVTPPIHAICSLAEVLPQHQDFRYSVACNKAKFVSLFKHLLVYPPEQQPLLCTRTTRKIVSTNPTAVLYSPRMPIEGSVVCHLGEVHLAKESQAAILDQLVEV